MTFRFRSLRAIALLAALPLVAEAQQISQLPRTTPTTGLADSALFLCTDSTKVTTRACKFSDVQKRLAYKAFDSLVTTKLTVTGATITGLTAASIGSGAFPSGTYSFTGATALTGGAGSMTIAAGTGNSRTMTLQSTTSAGTAKNTLVLGADSSTTALGRVITGCATNCGFLVKNAGNNVGFLWGSGSGGALQLGDGAGQFFQISQLSSDSLTYFSGNTTLMQLHWNTGSLKIRDSLLVSSTNSGSTGAAVIRGGAGNMSIIAGTGNSRTMTLKTTTSAGTAKNTLVLGSDSSATFLGNATFNSSTDATSITSLGVVAPFSTAAFPSFRFNGDADNGMYHFGTDTIGFATGGSFTLRISGGVSPNIVGNGSTMIRGGTSTGNTLTLRAGSNQNAIVVQSDSVQFSGLIYPAGNNGTNLGGTANSFNTAFVNNIDARNVNGMTITGGSGTSQANMTILAGTGTAGSMILRSSNSTGVATTFATGSGDTVKFGGHAIATGFTAAAGTPGSICYNTATSEITKNAATSCVVSSIRFKTDVFPLSPEWAASKLMALRPSSFTYRDGGRRSLGLIAENADSVDSRLGFRNADGTVNSYDQPGVLALLIATVQKQQLQIDSLRAEIRRKP